MLRWDEALAADPGLRAGGLRATDSCFDTQVTYAERLVLENLLAARAAGADIRTYSQVVHADVGDGAVRALEYEDRRSGQRESLQARVIINAARPWVDAVLDAVPGSGPDLIGTIDIRYEGDLNFVRAGPDEVAYMLAEINRVFPDVGLSKADIE